jgi:hypothetical protein
LSARAQDESLGAADGARSTPLSSALDKIGAEPHKLFSKTWLQQLAVEELNAVATAVGLEPHTNKPMTAGAIVDKLKPLGVRRVADIEGYLTLLDKVRCLLVTRSMHLSLSRACACSLATLA